jgi:hypothetical protein
MTARLIRERQDLGDLDGFALRGRGQDRHGRECAWRTRALPCSRTFFLTSERAGNRLPMASDRLARGDEHEER